MTDPAQEAVTRIASQLGQDVALDSDSLVLQGTPMALPTTKTAWNSVRFRQAFPSAAHGDQREKLVYKIVQDATGGSNRLLDDVFREQLADAVPLPDPFARQIVGAAIADEYWTVVKSLPYLIPYHTLLPQAFDHTQKVINPKAPASGPKKAARYKLFSGAVLPFLCWTGSGVDRALVQDFLDVMNAQDDFTQLDELMFGAARAVAGEEPRRATADQLMQSDLWQEVEAALRGGAFWQPGLDQFQTDLRTVLGMQASLPRRDLIDMLTSLLSLHLAIHYYRVAVMLGERMDRALAAAAGLEEPAPARGTPRGGPLAGRMLFRVGTRGDRPVRLVDPCVTTYRELTDRRLLALPAAITTMNLAHAVWEAVGGAPQRPDLEELAAAFRARDSRAALLDAGMAALAAIYWARTARGPEPGVDELLSVGLLRRPGLFALGQAITSRRRTGLRNLSRDVVNQLAQRETGSIIRKRGPAVFFELDEDFLFLLVKLICQSEQVDFATFLQRLQDYGLAPQDGDEEALLVAALERLGMLRRYADAGESMYVSHPIS
jgi:hypothetical protein